MNIGKTICSVRKSKGLNQVEFAKRCGISQTSLSQIETNTTLSPNPKNLEAIARELGLTVDMLYLLSIEEVDVPEKGRDTYLTLYSTLVNVAKDMLKATE